MRTLDQIPGILGHIVTQIVETELVVGTKGNICHISLTTGLAIGLVLINTIHTQAMEHIDGSHPLRVTLGQIIVHRYHMNTVTGKGIQEDGECSRKSLTFTREHLGNLTLVQYRTSEELYIKVYHIP